MYACHEEDDVDGGGDVEELEGEVPYVMECGCLVRVPPVDEEVAGEEHDEVEGLGQEGDTCDMFGQWKPEKRASYELC